MSDPVKAKTYQFPDKPKPGLYWWTGNAKRCKPELHLLTEVRDKKDGKVTGYLCKNLESGQSSLIQVGFGGIWLALDIEAIRPIVAEETA